MLVTGLGWDQGLILETRETDQEKRKTALPIGQRLAIEVSGQRSCIGYRPPGGSSLIPCQQQITEINGYQCPECLQESMNLPCLRCTGDYCRNPARRSQCVVPKNHALYLAAFSDTEIKVGVARWSRRHQRVAEQGARAGIIIARDDGQMIRRHEAQIKSLGIPDRLSAGRKMQALLQEPESDLLAILQRTKEGLQRRMRAPWIDSEPAEIIEQPTFPVAPRLMPPAGLIFSGQVAANWGQLLLISDHNQELVAIDAGTLIGHQIKERPLDTASSYQPALFSSLSG